MYFAGSVSWKHLKCHWCYASNISLSSLHEDMLSLSLRSVWGIFQWLDIRSLNMVSFQQVSDLNVFPEEVAVDEAQK